MHENKLTYVLIFKLIFFKTHYKTSGNVTTPNIHYFIETSEQPSCTANRALETAM